MFGTADTLAKSQLNGEVIRIVTLFENIIPFRSIPYRVAMTLQSMIILERINVTLNLITQCIGKSRGSTGQQLIRYSRDGG